MKVDCSNFVQKPLRTCILDTIMTWLQSGLQGFIAGGFIYMSAVGVMPSMHDQGSSFVSTVSQLVPMVLGMGVAVVISLAE